VAGEIRTAIETAGLGLWAAPHLSGEIPPDAVLLDVVPLATGCLAVWTAGEDHFVAPVVPEGSGARRAVAGDGVFAALASAIDVSHPSPGRGTVERVAGVDQTNESVIVGDAVVVKVIRRTRPGPQPGLDIPAHLAAVGFTETPEPVGAFTRGDTLLATSAVYLPSAADGWGWYVDLVEAAATGEASWEGAEAATLAIGELVARFQRALATPSAIVPDPVGTADAATVAGWRERAVATLDEALALTEGPVGERLRGHEREARRIMGGFDEISETPVARIHGDLHVGQILRVPDGRLFVIDLDGDPVAPVGERVAPGSPARDVASMACALDHVGRVVARRHRLTHDVIEAWIARARSTFLAAHRGALGPDVSLFDDRLLLPFAVAQEAHEFVYAARFLPRWNDVPDAALPAVLAWANDG
jgi:maltokinase